MTPLTGRRISGTGVCHLKLEKNIDVLEILTPVLSWPFKSPCDLKEISACLWAWPFSFFQWKHLALASRFQLWPWKTKSPLDDMRSHRGCLSYDISMALVFSDRGCSFTLFCSWSVGFQFCHCLAFTECFLSFQSTPTLNLMSPPTCPCQTAATSMGIWDHVSRAKSVRLWPKIGGADCTKSHIPMCT